MREPLKISESKILAAVETHYGVSAAAFSFLPLGNDSATSVYRLTAHDATNFFVKVRTAAGFRIPSLAVPQFLHEHGVPHILAPLRTNNRSLWVMVSEFALTVYPFIQDGRTAARAGISDAQWHEFGAIVRRFHEHPLTPQVLELVPRERFVPKQRELISVLETAMSRRVLANEAERELADYWQTQRGLIQHLVNRVDSLGAQLRHSTAPRVLCHADMHTYNLLVDRANEFWLVDWDEAILALPERDLMFVVGGISRALVTLHQTELFLRGYGGAPPDPFALTYYRYAWAVQDLAAYGESVLLLPGLSKETRHEAVQGFKGLFAPGEIVEIAMASGF